VLQQELAQQPPPWLLARRPSIWSRSVAPKLEELKPMVSMSAAIKAVHFIETRLLYGVTSYPTLPKSRSPSRFARRSARWRQAFGGNVARCAVGYAVVGRRSGTAAWRPHRGAPEPVESSMDSNDPLR
jgi:hypothetical protein